MSAEVLVRCIYPTTLRPMLRAVPSIIFTTESMRSVLVSGSFLRAISCEGR